MESQQSLLTLLFSLFWYECVCVHEKERGIVSVSMPSSLLFSLRTQALSEKHKLTRIVPSHPTTEEEENTGKTYCREGSLANLAHEDEVPGLLVLRGSHSPLGRGSSERVVTDGDGLGTNDLL